MYALLRHPWLRKVLGGSPCPQTPNRGGKLSSPRTVLGITTRPRTPKFRGADLLLHQRRIRQLQVDAFYAGFNGQNLQVLAEGAAGDTFAQVLANLGFDVFVREL